MDTRKFETIRAAGVLTTLVVLLGTVNIPVIVKMGTWIHRGMVTVAAGRGGGKKCKDKLA